MEVGQATVLVDVSIAVRKDIEVPIAPSQESQAEEKLTAVRYHLLVSINFFQFVSIAAKKDIEVPTALYHESLWVKFYFNF